MAAPATTTRVTPAGIILFDGFSTTIAFALDTDVSFWEVTVQPPGIDGGDALDISNMHNTTVKTMRPRQLYLITDSNITAQWDPDVWNNIVDNLINKEGSITVAFLDGSVLDFYGYLRTFEPSALEEAVVPEATLAITVTNYDEVNDLEAVPVLTSVAGS